MRWEDHKRAFARGMKEWWWMGPPFVLGLYLVFIK